MHSTSLFVFAAALSVAATAPAAQAQSAVPAPADTARYYRHHLGLTASPQLQYFFTANRRLPVGLLYKRQTAPNKLWRFGLVLNQDYSRRDENENNAPPLPFVGFVKGYTSNVWGISASIGREFSHQFSRRWTGTVGGDINLGLSSSRAELITQSAPPLIEGRTITQSNYYYTSLAPFIGVRYALWPAFYVSAESTISFSYLRSSFDPQVQRIDLSTGKIEYEKSFQQSKDQSWGLGYQFIRQVSMHYLLRGN